MLQSEATGMHTLRPYNSGEFGRVLREAISVIATMDADHEFIAQELDNVICDMQLNNDMISNEAKKAHIQQGHGLAEEHPYVCTPISFLQVLSVPTSPLVIS